MGMLGLQEHLNCKVQQVANTQEILQTNVRLCYAFCLVKEYLIEILFTKAVEL